MQATIDPVSQYTSRTSAFHVRPDGAASGLYIYFDVTQTTIGTVFNNDAYYLNVTANDGLGLVPQDANTAHQFLECSGRGTCDRMAGACQCVAGYTGDACQRTSCPNDCSGNGICQSQAYFVSDVASSTGINYAYSGFDAASAYGCKCDSGFRGADCSQSECPSGPDPMKGPGGAEGMDCSGRGLCDYTKGVCKCACRGAWRAAGAGAAWLTATSLPFPYPQVSRVSSVSAARSCRRSFERHGEGLAGVGSSGGGSTAVCCR